jgi:hypothetical protein
MNFWRWGGVTWRRRTNGVKKAAWGGLCSALERMALTRLLLSLIDRSVTSNLGRISEGLRIIALKIWTGGQWNAMQVQRTPAQHVV